MSADTRPKSAIELIQAVVPFFDGIIAAGSDYPRQVNLEAHAAKSQLKEALELLIDDGRWKHPLNNLGET